jgi:hypothetical protein
MKQSTLSFSRYVGHLFSFIQTKHLIKARSLSGISKGSPFASGPVYRDPSTDGERGTAEDP